MLPASLFGAHSTQSAAIQFGGQKLPLAARAVVEALFTTITYRLEPQGRGSRFPLLMDHLYAGRLEAASVCDALAELDAAGRELHVLPTDRIVSSPQWLRRFDPTSHVVNHRAASVHDYFISPEGTPLIALIRSALGEALLANQSVRLESGEALNRVRLGVLALFLGAGWSCIGYAWFGEYVIVPGGSNSHGGLLVWSLGLPVAALGAVSLIGGPAERLRRQIAEREWLAAAFGLVLAALWFALAWRG